MDGEHDLAADFARLIGELRACTVCAPHLPLPPKPVFQLHPAAPILIVGQAPGRRAREPGRVFDDPSGDRLRAWLGVDRETFYDPRRFAILPTGMCWPGKKGTGDAPPRPECAPLWHPRILPHLRHVRLRLFVGRYAAERYLIPAHGRTLSEVLERWRDLPADVLALPHPSPRNRWPDLHPRFEAELVPELRRRVRSALED